MQFQLNEQPNLFVTLRITGTKLIMQANHINPLKIKIRDHTVSGELISQISGGKGKFYPPVSGIC
jgi:hypothetical protein